MHKNSGFTIIELFIVLLIMAVISAIAMPNFLSWIPGKRLMSAADDLYSNLQYAKMQAIKNNNSWAVTFNPGGGTQNLGSYDVVSDFGGVPSAVRTVNLADYKSGVTFGGGDSTKNYQDTGTVEADGVAYAGDIVVFNARGLVSSDLNFAYLANEHGDAVAVGTPAMSGVIIQRVWTAGDWK
jgi:prepilin-type N-terminal cleavage/methylation domain-containing protein